MGNLLPRGVARRVNVYVGWAAKTWEAARRARREHGVGFARAFREQVWLLARHGINPYAYYEYRLYDSRLSRDEKAAYLAEGRRVMRRLWSLFVPVEYRALYNNKLIFNRFFGAAGLPVATIHGVFDRAVGYAAGGCHLRTEEELRRLLRRVGDAGFVFKPVYGIRGDRVLVFEGPAPDAADAWLTLAGERYTAEQLVTLTREGEELAARNPGSDTSAFLVESRMRPHAALAELLGPTLCTARVQTIINRRGAPEIVAAVFKLQPGNAGVDHLLYGAVGCWVDVETGVLGRGRSRSHHDDVTTIPGTDREFVGYRLPDWPAAREVALRAAAAFPWVRSVGWDIGLSDRGPILIEGNERWSPSLIQLPAPHGLMTGEFKAVRDELRARGGR